jgi:poly-gamma-glutamate capsule biosynthesis protein CapA/YwtB (metallophosphatase superfamily)
VYARSRAGGMITLFLCGDVMTGRGIDQVLPTPGDPQLHESYVRDARTYIDLAERANGPIVRPASFEYVWGAALDELDRAAPDVRIINLETSVTRSDDYWPDKGINYRMHPDNVRCLSVAGIDCCVLANNHVLDWGHAGLQETLETLHAAGLRTAGAGLTRDAAAAPAVIDLAGKGRVLVFGFGSETSGCPLAWKAQAHKSGISLTALSRPAAKRAVSMMEPLKAPGDIVVASIHWGGNWDYAIPREQQKFAWELIDSGVVDIVHGHSSHHPKGIEVYRDKPIIYGCGDFLNDYEGISGHERYRGDLSLMYFASMDTSDGRLASLQITPLRMRRFSLHRVSPTDAKWLEAVLNREGRALGTRIERNADNTLAVRWESEPRASYRGRRPDQKRRSLNVS